MKAYVPYHPTHPGTYAFHKLGCGSGISSKLDTAHLARAFRVARCFTLFFILVAFTSCGSIKKSTKVEATQQLDEHQERVSFGQSIFAFIDSLNATHSIEADSLELEIFALEIPSVDKDNLAATRPPRSEASGRLAARLSMKGIRSNMQLTHTQTASAESLSEDTVSTHRFGHQKVTESSDSEKVVKPPNTLRNLAFLIMAIAILLGVLLIAAGKFKF